MSLAGTPTPANGHASTIGEISRTCLIKGNFVSVTCSRPFSHPSALSLRRRGAYRPSVTSARPSSSTITFGQTPMEVRVFMHIPRTFFFFPTSLGFPHSCRTTSEFSHQRRWYSGRTRSHAWTGVFNLDVTIVTRDACASWNTGAAAFSHQCYRRPHTPLTLSTCGVFAEVSATILDD